MTEHDVAIIDDSTICRQRLRSIVQADGDLRVVAELSSGHDVVATLDRTRPAVLVTDLVMPDIDGLAVIRTVMKEHPIPIVVVSGAGFTSESAFEATRLGALEVATKPELGDRAAEAALREALRRVAQVPVVRHPGHVVTRRQPVTLPPTSLQPGPAIRAVGIGASAGGPPAVVELICALPPEVAPTILVAQHMPSGHAESFARFLSARCPFDVIVAQGSVSLRPGLVVIPGDDRHLVATSGDRAKTVAADGELVPSADRLLQSLAELVGPRAAGVVLSGIGDDGARGLAALQAAGGLTLAQDHASSAVFGMPKAAASAARFQLPPREIGRVIAGAVAHGLRSQPP